MTAPQQDPNNFLMGGGGARSASFLDKGDTVTGTIVSNPELRQQTEYVRGGGAGKPLFWDNGDPKMQLVVKVQTSERLDADDDGIRALYIKGGFKRPTMQKAVADAVRNAGADGLAVGGTLTVTLTGKDGDGPDAAKNYSATYKQPVAGGDFLGTQPTTTQAPPAQQQAPAAAAPAATGGLVTVEINGVTQQVTPEVAALLQQVQPA